MLSSFSFYIYTFPIYTLTPSDIHFNANFNRANIVKVFLIYVFIEPQILTIEKAGNENSSLKQSFFSFNNGHIRKNRNPTLFHSFYIFFLLQNVQDKEYSNSKYRIKQSNNRYQPKTDSILSNIENQ